MVVRKFRGATSSSPNSTTNPTSNPASYTKGDFVPILKKIMDATENLQGSQISDDMALQESQVFQFNQSFIKRDEIK